MWEAISLVNRLILSLIMQNDAKIAPISLKRDLMDLRIDTFIVDNSAKGTEVRQKTAAIEFE